jgi:hypothetical protein
MSSQTHRLKLRSGCAGLGLSRSWQEENRRTSQPGSRDEVISTAYQGEQVPVLGHRLLNFCGDQPFG